MLISEFNYHLPKSAIAQHPLKTRDQSRLLVIDRKTGSLLDQKFIQLPEILSPGDLLVVNNCRVIPARLFAKRKTGAGLEITLLGKIKGGIWECLLKGKKPKANEQVEIGQGVSAIFLKELDLDLKAGWTGGLWQIQFSKDDPEILEQLGVMPLPPYIKRGAPEDYVQDRTRYQTIFADQPGAVAAPTAGLHFTDRVIQKLKDRGIGIAEITLDVGFGTFAPVRSERIEDHKMYSEKYRVNQEASEKINQARKKGGRIIAVGTTSARTLEAAISFSQISPPLRGGDQGEGESINHQNSSGRILAQEGETDLFIYPGYCFQAVDALLTNFHMPRSTLLMLVSAFAGLDLIRKAYCHALEQGYRFLSYGDCMLIK